MMGLAASAGLVFGIDCGEDRPFEYNDDTDLGEYLAAREGVVSPYVREADLIDPMTLAEFSEWKLTHPEFGKAANDHFDLRRQLEDQAPVEIVRYSSYDVSMYIVAIKGTRIEADWGSPESVEILTLMESQPTPAIIDNVADWCQQKELPPFAEPSWLLYAKYG